MGLWQRLFGGAEDKNPHPTKTVFQSKWSTPPKRELNDFLTLFHTSPAMVTFRDICTDVANIEIYAHGKGDKEKKVSTHPLLDLLENPMPSYPTFDAFQVRFLTEAYWAIAGEAFWLLMPGPRGKPSEAYIVPPGWVIKTPTADSAFFHIVPDGQTAGAAIMVPAFDMIWFRDPNLRNPFGRGRGMVEALGDELESDEYASKFAKKLFFNDATPDLLIQAPGITTEQAETFKEEWMRNYAGLNNRKKPAIINSESIKVEKLSTTPKELDMTESRRFLRDMMTQFWGVSPELRGNLENSNRSTIESAYYLYTKNVLSKRAKRWEAVINRQLAPRFDDKTEICFDVQVPEDQEFKLKAMSEGLRMKAVTINEWRKSQGLDPIQGGDVVIQDEAPQAPEQKAVGKAIETDRRKKALAHWDSFDKAATLGEDGFIAATKTTARLQNRALMKAAYKNLGDGLSVEASWEQAIRTVYGPEADAVLKDRMAPAWMDSMRRGLDLSQEVLGKQLSLQIANPLFESWVRTHGVEKATMINDTTMKDLRAVVLQGVQDGKSMDNLAADLQAVYSELSDRRALTIARTETANTVNYGQHLGYQLAGVKREEWIATPDERTRDAHQVGIMWGEGPLIADINEAFIIGGEALQFPGDPSGSAENVINCRCSIAPVIDLEGDL